VLEFSLKLITVISYVMLVVGDCWMFSK